MNREKRLAIRLQATGGEKLRSEFSRLGSSGKRAFGQISTAAKPASVGLKAVDASARALNGVFRQAVGLIGVYAGLHGISSALRSLVTTNRDFEKLQASLTTVTGSAQAATQAFKMIEDFASSTPFNLQQIVEAFIKLQALGLEPSRAALRSYGNTASAMGKSLQQLVEAIADATTGEFERLKEFGIKARSQGQLVSFTFQGVSTTVGKNAAEIESYLRQIGEVKFAGAMSKQMSTLGGIFSNIQDNFAKLARDVGAGGLNDAIREVASSLKAASDQGREAARSLGKTFGTIIKTTAAGLGLLAKHGRMAVEVLTGLLIAKTVGKVFLTLRAALLGQAGLILGLRLMAQVSTASAAKLVLVAGATKTLTLAMVGLRRAMLLVGGPVGVAVLAGLALYKLVTRQQSATQAARDHATSLEQLKQGLKKTSQAVEQLTASTRDQAIVSWTSRLQTAEKNVAALTRQLKFGGVGSLSNQASRWFTNLQVELSELQSTYRSGKIGLEEYSKALTSLAVKYPQFANTSQQTREQILILQAALLDQKRAIQELERLRNNSPQSYLSSANEQRINSYISQVNKEITALKQLAATKKQTTVAQGSSETELALQRFGLSLTDAENDKKAALAKTIAGLIKEKQALLATEKSAQQAGALHQKTIKEITTAYQTMQAATSSAEQSLLTWRATSLASLDQTSASYQELAAQVEAIFNHKLPTARAKDLASSQNWQDGIQRGLMTVIKGAGDLAKQTEKLLVKVFSRLEDSLINLVTTGKFEFQKMVAFMIEELARMAIRQMIILPLTQGLIAHQGGVIGVDHLAKVTVSSSNFTHAPRFHRGGLAGNEVPIIAQRGEAILTPGQMRLLGKNNQRIQVNVHNYGSGQVKTKHSQRQDQSLQLDILIEQVESELGKNINRSSGLAPTLEHRYGLNPAAGSYR